MPRSKAHKIVGTTAGFAGAIGYGSYYQNDQENAWQYAIGGALGGYATARLADILEPSKTLGPNHRGVFHGIALNGTLAASGYDWIKGQLQILVDKANKFDNSNQHFVALLFRLIVGFLIGALTGHASHLSADFLFSPSRLPLLA